MFNFDNVFSSIFSVLYLVLTFSAIIVMLLENRNPVRSFSWLLVMVVLPIIGLILYLIFGQSFSKNQFIQKKSIRSLTQRTKGTYDIEQLAALPLDAAYLKLVKLLYNNGHSIGYGYSNISVLSDGESSFEAMFNDIKNAKEHIHIEFFIFADDKISNLLRELLIQKAHEGVRVRMIYDYWGSLALSFSKKYLKSLREAGVYVTPFLPLQIRLSRSRINYRNHRKIIVIDGKIGFTGGINVADRYIYGNELGKWRDTIVRLEGSVVHGLQMLFLVDWYFVGKKLITNAKYFPKPHIFKNNNLIQVVSSGPDTNWQTILQGYTVAIAAAKKYVYIHTPYYIPPEVLNTCVQTAALSGIDVRLMIPTKSDTWLTHIGTSNFLGQILQAGVKVYQYGEGFLHSKAIVIDDIISIVGSCNMDERSFMQNFEANVFIYDTATAEHLKQLFVRDMEQCSELTLAQWKIRSRWQKVKEAFVRLFAPLL